MTPYSPLEPDEKPRRWPAAIITVGLVGVLAASDVAPDNGEVAAADAALAASRAAVFESALRLFVIAPNAKSYDVSTAALLDAARGHPEILAGYVRRFGPYYTGAKPKAGPERADGVTAGAMMWVAGSCGFAAVIAPLLTDKSPACVVYAYAEAHGIRLYHRITEDAGIDQIVGPEQAREILDANGLLPAAKP